MAYAEAFNENVIEFLKGQKTATVTLCNQTKLNTRVRKIAQERPEECQIVHENTDGSIVAHIPTKWIKINPSKIMTEEQKQVLKERAAKFGFKKKTITEDESEEDGYIDDLDWIYDTDEEDSDE